jgi:hypothetical protein
MESFEERYPVTVDAENPNSLTVGFKGRDAQATFERNPANGNVRMSDLRITSGAIDVPPRVHVGKGPLENALARAQAYFSDHPFVPPTAQQPNRPGVQQDLFG